MLLPCGLIRSQQRPALPQNQCSMRLFISHGLDKLVTRDMQFLNGLVAALQAPAGAGELAPELLLDRDRLGAGDRWRDVLHEWLAECDAAVLLLSPRALASPWVLKEATVLAWRKAMDPGFPLYPVLLGGLASDALAASGFSPLCLRDLQAIRPPAADPQQPEALDAATALAIAGPLRRQLAAWLAAVGDPPGAPLTGLENALKDRIRQASNIRGLERLCQQLTGRALQWRPAGTAPQQAGAHPARLIAALLACGLPGPPDAAPANPLATLVDRLRTDCGLRNAEAGELLELLAPLWTSAESAARLAEVAGRNRLPAAPGATPPPGISVALQCDSDAFAPAQHVRRMLLPTTRGEVVCHLPGGHSDNRLAELQQAVRQAFRDTTRAHGKPDAWVDAQLARTDKPLHLSRTVFFVVPAPLPDAALLAALQASFPRLTFILQSAEPLPAVLPPRVVALAAIDPNLEFDMQTDLDDADNLLRQRSTLP